MKITSVNNKIPKSTSFQSCFRIYSSKPLKNFNIFGCEKIRTSTNVFREDLDWFGLIKYMNKHFKQKDKVNIYSLACSDGSEAYTMAISVFENLQDNIQSKMLPIYASDIDNEVIKTANAGRINIFTIEFLYPEKTYNCNIGKYFNNPNVSEMIKGDEISETDTIRSYQPIQKLKNAVKFKKSDILTELNNLNDSGNSVILCRNVFPYLNSKYTDEIINTASLKLKKGSLFIIGDYDNKVNTAQKLLVNGFKQPMYNSSFVKNGNNIFERI